MTSILQKARDEGYRNGAGHMSQANYDDAFWEGQQSAYSEAPSRLLWWALGVLCGAAITFGIMS